TIRLWNTTDPTKPTPLANLVGHTGIVWQAVFSPDGHTLVSASDDGTVRLWETDPQRVVKRFCADPNLRITPEEWKRYIPKIPYPNPCA
ncbi:WD40 repeat domain-containing protein, partial [Frankia sp. Cr2]|uniref:WD40 repeat domain-containing protein n=1 Tax=Frankia sp. Cr2 TaxID=3073932 RepID=UPI003A0FED40